MAEIYVAPSASLNGVALAIDPITNAFILAYAGKLKQVLINLTANAIRFTPAGGSVRLSVHYPPARTSRWVTITVTDTGHGIPLDKMSKLFEPFSNLGIPTLDGLGGSGLGLPISREFATAMGGELEANSNGHGSTFT